MNRQPIETRERARIDALEAENDELRERIRQLERTFLNTEWTPPVELGLTIGEARIVGMLAVREEATTKDMFMTALYGLRPDSDQVEPKIIDVFVCKARRKLARYGIEIGTVWGRGYIMPEASRNALINWCKTPETHEVAHG